MGIEIGVIGTGGSGRSTVFELLVGGAHSARPGEPQRGVVELEDERLDFISKLTRATKKTPLKVDLLLPQPSTLPVEQHLNQVRNCDAFIHVVRNFSLGDQAPRPKEDFFALRDEMVLLDLAIVEKRLQHISQDKKKGKGINPREIGLLEIAKDMLEKNIPLARNQEVSSATELRGFRFLTSKPYLVVLNSPDEGAEPFDISWCEAANLVEIRARLENDLMKMSEDERREFTQAYGIGGLSKKRILELILPTLGRICFYTYVSGEARVWSVPKGLTALDAAGEIHTDIKKGFIRAEVVSFADLKKYGDFATCKKAGAIRLEGKEYIVQDGDVITFRFNL